jgi:Restriction endonuclease
VSGERDWRQYERQIFERLKEMAGDEGDVEFDATLPGRFSGTDRQIDALVRGNFASKVTRASMAVDCKCFGRKVNVKDVEMFMGLVQDVGTDFGLLVTTEGFSEAAKRRAATPGLRIDIVPYEELAVWEPPFYWCEVCTDPQSDRMPGGVYIDPFTPGLEPPGAELAAGVERCDRCDAVYMECSCGTLNHAVEMQEGEWLECEGGCGVEWKVEVEVDRKGMPLTFNCQQQVEFRRGDLVAGARRN